MKEHRYLQDVLRESGALQLIANQLNEEQDLDLHEKVCIIASSPFTSFLVHLSLLWVVRFFSTD
jgi:hypothetical protein